MASPSKVRVCDGSVGGTAGSNLAQVHECLSVVSVMCCQVEVSVVSVMCCQVEVSVVSVMCCQVEVSATDRSLVQRSPTVCGM